MRIALVGYGKMGHIIEEVARERGHDVVLKIKSSNIADFTQENMAKADVAIEFTNPDSAFHNVVSCINFGVPVVSGSTGWNENIEAAKTYCLENDGSFLHASNFSIGVNIFFEINKHLAKLMSDQKEYNVRIHEIHHTQKKDAPSGTAVTLADQILANMERKNKWVAGETSNPSAIAVTSERIDPAPGTHHVKYFSEVDDIEIIHTAHNRRGFAIGAVMAAEYIADKKGVFYMKDVLGIN